MVTSGWPVRSAASKLLSKEREMRTISAVMLGLIKEKDRRAKEDPNGTDK